MIPDPGALVLLIAVALLGWAVFRMCTYRDLTDIDATEGFDEPRREPEDATRRRPI